MSRQVARRTGSAALFLGLSIVLAGLGLSALFGDSVGALQPTAHAAEQADEQTRTDQLPALQQRLAELEQRVAELEKELKQERKQDPVKLLTPETSTEVIIKGKGKPGDIAEPLDPNRPQGSENWERKRFNGLRYYIVPLGQK